MLGLQTVVTAVFFFTILYLNLKEDDATAGRVIGIVTDAAGTRVGTKHFVLFVTPQVLDKMLFIF